VSRREQIKMDDAEVAAFLAGERTVTCATVGLRGWPHLMPLWYVPRETSAGEPTPRIWAWTYGASQKVSNLERDPRATLQVEAEVVVHRELELVAELGAEIMLRNSVPRGVQPPAELPQEVREVVAAQAVKRVALEFVELRRATWDHRKLGGLY
jgi:hypothetical protein